MQDWKMTDHFLRRIRVGKSTDVVKLRVAYSKPKKTPQENLTRTQSLNVS